MRVIAVAALLTAAAGIAGAQTPSTQKTAVLKNGAGATIGQVTLTDAPRGVLLRVEASGLAPGWHGIHFHEKGDCSDPAFKMAGGHVHQMSPTVHGLLNPQANDLGDLPNLYAGPDGKANAEFYSTFVAMHDGTARANLLDADGSAVVIHAKVDDLATQPIGGAGDRVACAVVK
jgi:Cu-Zn family superoxide dismutase